MAARRKNAWGKTRPQDNPYFAISRGDWTWRILKAWQPAATARENEFARYFCAVSSPFTAPGVDMGDVYVRDIPGYGSILAAQQREEEAA